MYFNVGGIHVVDSGIDLDGGIDAAQLLFGRNRFREVVPDVLFIEKRLPLKIRKLHKVAVNQPHEPDTRTDDLIGSNRAERTEPQNQNASRCQPLLSGVADRGEPPLPRISIIEGQWLPSPA
jgi:hypothetical protein